MTQDRFNIACGAIVVAPFVVIGVVLLLAAAGPVAPYLIIAVVLLPFLALWQVFGMRYFDARMLRRRFGAEPVALGMFTLRRFQVPGGLRDKGPLRTNQSVFLWLVQDLAVITQAERYIAFPSAGRRVSLDGWVGKPDITFQMLDGQDWLAQVRQDWYALIEANGRTDTPAVKRALDAAVASEPSGQGTG